MAKAANANDLGAPAEGFGQNVTFAYQPGQVPNAVDLGRATPVVAGTDGAQNVGMQDHTIVAAKLPEDRSYQMLMNIGEEIMGPKVKEARNAAFVKGMQKAAQGEAVTSIVEDQPWYSKIFGDSDVVAGARAYTGHAKAAEAAGVLEDQMPALRAMDPAQAQQVFAKTISAAQTGDAVTDTQIMQTLTAQMPALFRRQAKEHYAYKQDQASAAEAKSMMAGAKALQAAAQGTVAEVSGEDRDGNAVYYPGVTKPEEFAAQSDAYVKSIIPAQGRDLENWQKSTARTMQTMARGGMFHALNAIEAKGGFDALTDEQRQKVMDTRDSEEKQQRSLNEGPYLRQIAAVQAGIRYSDQPSTVAGYVKQMQDINSAYSARTGSKLGLFPPEKMVQLATSGLEEVYKERRAQYKLDAAKADKALTADAKVRSDAEASSGVAGMIQQGMAFPPGTKDEHITAAWALVRKTGPEAYGSAVVRAANGGEAVIDKETARLMQGAVNDSTSVKDPTALLAMYNNFYLPILSAGKKGPDGQWTGTAGETTAGKYMGTAEAAKAMRVFHTYMSMGQPAAGFQNAFILPPLSSKISGTDKDDQKLIGAVKSNLSHFPPEWFGTGEEHGNIDIRADQVPFISGLVKHQAEIGRIHQDDWKASTGIALGFLRSEGGQGLTVTGGYAYLAPTGSTKLVQNLNSGADPVPANKVAALFRDTLREKIENIGMDASNPTQVIRVKDGPGGDPNFVASVTSSDGDTKWVTLTGSELRGRWVSKKATKAIEADKAEVQRKTLTDSEFQSTPVESTSPINDGTATD